MDFEHSERAQIVMEQVKGFIQRRVLPNEQTYQDQLVHTDDWTRWQIPPIVEELKAEARDLGLWNLFLPDEEHGAGLDNRDYAPVAELMGRSFLAPEVFNSAAPDTGNAEVLAQYGSDLQKEQWLVPLLAGEIRSGFSMTEPAVASSDATNMKATAELDGDEVVLNGQKWWTSGAGDPRCRFLIFMGVTDADAGRHQRHSMVIVPIDSPGVKILRMLPVFGHLGEPHGHAEILFDNVRLPIDSIVAGPGRGFEIAQGRLGPGRIHHCMRIIGAAERALERLCERAVDRVAFGKALVNLGANRDIIANSRMAIDQARLLTLRAAWELDTSGVLGALVSISAIKVIAPNVLQQVVDAAIQIHGGEGVADPELSYLMGMARALRLADGPDEVHRAMVARLEIGEVPPLIAQVPSHGVGHWRYVGIARNVPNTKDGVESTVGMSARTGELRGTLPSATAGGGRATLPAMATACWTRRPLLLLAAVLVLGACSSDGDDGADASSGDAPPATADAADIYVPPDLHASDWAAPDVALPEAPRPYGPSPEATADPAFYDVTTLDPAEVGAADPGAVLRSEEVELTGPLAGASGWRILYRSTDASGAPAVVSGMVLVPDGAPPEGGRPVVAWAHGTTGIADRCAPSATGNLFYDDYGAQGRRLLDQGYVVTATDYHGLGTRGVHTYHRSEELARATIDSVAAAHQLEDAAPLSTQWATVGHSEGGLASLAVDERSSDALAGLDYRGSVVAAPTPRLGTVAPLMFLVEGRGYGVLLLEAVAGVAPELDPSVALGAEAATRTALLTHGCWEEAVPGFDDIDPEQMLAGPSVGERLAEVMADWAAVDPAAAQGPLLVVQGEADTSVLPPFTEELVDELCTNGVDVEYRTFAGAEHDPVLAAAADDVAGWLAARFAGEPPTNRCGAG